MRLKQYTVKSMQEGLRLIQKDLGDDAVMLSSKNITLPDGSKGIEITAAVEKFTPAEKPSNMDIKRKYAKLDTTAASRYIAPESVEEKLLTHGVCGETSRKIANAIKALEGSGFETEDALEMILGKLINFQIPSKVLKRGRPVVLIGSTGAGKTTTIAKLSVNQVAHKNTVGLITLDNFKIGAREQIKIFADALKVESKAVKSFKELKTQVEEFTHSKDYTFIDTAGLNPFKDDRKQALQEMLAALDNPYIMLVIPSNLNMQELSNIPFAFKGIEVSGLMFSKIDETNYLGGVINAAIDSQLEICYATDGQNIPQDILELDAKSLARKLLQDIKLPWENK